jgi:hypothetical protein
MLLGRRISLLRQSLGCYLYTVVSIPLRGVGLKSSCGQSAQAFFGVIWSILGMAFGVFGMELKIILLERIFILELFYYPFR